MNISDKELKHYFKQISFLMPIHRKQERLFLKKIKEEVKCYINNHPESSYDDLIDHFDEPINAVYNYISALDPEELCRAISVSRIKKAAIILFIVLIIAVSSIRTIFLYDAWKASYDSIITTEETIIGD